MRGLAIPGPARVGVATHWLTRAALLRSLGLVYAVAFVVAALQLRPLIGAEGLTPAAAYLDAVAAQEGGAWAGFLRLPSIFWLGCGDAAMAGAAWLGVLGGLAAMAGVCSAWLMLLLWALYLSIVHVGQTWYGFGWETLLLEAGFLAIFLAPWRGVQPMPPHHPPPMLVIWLYRWLGFRLMLGAGLIKLRGDGCWRDLSCLIYHYETQPNPHPLSLLFHRLPVPVHQLGVLTNHVVELVLPWFLVLPGRWRTMAALGMILFQVTLILSGNLAFLNWLTIAVMLACLDDAALLRVFPRQFRDKMRQRIAVRQLEAKAHPARMFAHAALAALVALLSVNVVGNLVSSRQAMNSSFDRLHLVNTYGAFGSVGRERLMVVFQGTGDAVPDSATEWLDYRYKCQPVALDARPCWITPYHLRLDWQVWFAPFSDLRRHPWLIHMAAKLLRNDPLLLSAMGENPFPDAPPRYVRIQEYRYRFVAPGQPGWWTREPTREYMRPVSLDDPEFLAVLQRYGWR